MRYAKLLHKRSDSSNRKSAIRNRRRSAGVTLTELMVVIAVLLILLCLALVGLQSVIQHGRTVQCSNHLLQLSTAIAAFESTHQHLPSGGWGKNWAGISSLGVGPEQPGGWIYQILPQLDQSNLVASGAIADAHSPQSAVMLETVLAVLYCPSRRLARTLPNSRQWNPHLYEKPDRVARNDYVMNGGDTLLVYGEGPESLEAASRFRWPKMTHATGLVFMRSWMRGAAITDGRSNVYLVGEKYIPVEQYKTSMDWGDNEGTYGGDDRDLVRFTGITRYSPLQPLSDRINDQKELMDSGVRFGSAHPNGVQMAYADGSIRMVDFDIDLKVHMRAGNRDCIRRIQQST